MSLAPERFAPDTARNEDEWVKAVRESLLEAGRVCMLGDKEVGVYLSGGIDSLSAMALVRQAYPDLKVQTFSIGYTHAETGEAVGELDFARQMAGHFKTEHHEILVTPADLVASLGTFDLPPDSILHLCNRKLAAAAAGAGVNVALCGEGSDEIFFGYDHFHAAVGFLEPSLAWLGKNFSLRGNYAKSLDPASAKLEDLFRGGGVNIDMDNDRSRLFAANGHGGRPVREFVAGLLAELRATARDVELDKQIIYIDFCQKLPENTLRRGEGPSMAQGVEMRFPFLWPDLIDLLYTMPMAVRVGEGTTKHILRKAMQPFLPAAALVRPKSPFGLPAARRMHFDKAGLVFDRPAFEHFFWKHRERLSAAVLDGAYTRERLFNSDFIAQRLAAQADRDTAFYDGFLWKLWNFAEWYERWIASKEAPCA
jgi:asparagine synthase (glutamine-hydrolysing)